MTKTIQSHQRVRAFPLVGASSQIQNMKLGPKNNGMHLHNYNVKHTFVLKMVQMPSKLN